MTAIEGVRPDGSRVSIDLHGRRLVAFLTSSCQGCAWWWGHLDKAPSGVPELAAVVTPDPSLESARAVSQLAPQGVSVVMSSDTWNRFSVRQSTTFLVLDEGRVSARAVPTSWQDILAIPALAHRKSSDPRTE